MPRRNSSNHCLHSLDSPSPTHGCWRMSDVLGGMLVPDLYPKTDGDGVRSGGQGGREECVERLQDSALDLE